MQSSLSLIISMYVTRVINGVSFFKREMAQDPFVMHSLQKLQFAAYTIFIQSK